MDWSGFALALVAFFATHTVPVRTPIKPYLVRKLGQKRYSALYGLVSLAVLAWVIVAAGRAPFVPLWGWAPWQPWLALGLMLLASLLFSLSVARPNPFSFGGVRNDQFDPAEPGPIRLTRHPILAVLALWSGAHVLANGDLARVIVFGLFFVFAVFGGRLIDRRKRREMGPDWQALWGEVARQPLLASGWRDAKFTRRLGIGVGFWLLMLVLHPLVIGVSPLPPLP
ncbi:MAG: NnrU family protein [Pseudomonadota bacterium]